MEERYTRNIPTISENEQNILKTKTALVLGCGGIGGYVIEYLARLGIGHIIVADGDVFNETNLNRQLLCTASNIGNNKAVVAAKRIAAINPDIEVTAIEEYYSDEKYHDLLKVSDVVIDSLDNVRDRLTLEDICADAGLILVHGAIHGWSMQVGVITPGSNMLHKIYNSEYATTSTCLCPTPACCAALQVSEAVKVLLNRDSTLANKIMFMDLETMESNVVQI